MVDAVVVVSYPCSGEFCWGHTMRLNPPSLLVFLIALVLALMAMATKLGYFQIPRYIPFQEYWLALTAYLTLMVGCVVKGL